MKKILASLMLFVVFSSLLTTNAYAKENFQNQLALKNQTYSLSKEMNDNEKKSLIKNTTDEKVSLDDIVYSSKMIYYVKEIYDKNGKVVDSHLMTNEEVLYDSIPLVAKSAVGTDKTTNTKQTLTIYLIVYTSNGDYVANGVAEWTTKSVVGGKNYPDAAGEDFVAITWGGNKKLMGTKDRSISGVYYNGNNVVFSKATSDSYVGYCWQFKEKTSGLGSNLHTINCLQTITKVNPNTNYNSQTNVRFTYIHTYNEVDGTISFTAKTDKSLAAGVSLSSVKDQWQIEVDVPGLKY